MNILYQIVIFIIMTIATAGAIWASCVWYLPSLYKKKLTFEQKLIIWSIALVVNIIVFCGRNL